MIFESTHINRSVLRSKVCIIGGGPVGISCAYRLAKNGIHVTLVAGGGKKENRKEQDLYKGTVDPEGSHEPLEENRRRMWGGTSTAWGGRCVPFNTIDFRKRSWIPNSGWPISKAEAEQCIPEALSFCEAGRDLFDSTKLFPKTPQGILPGFDDLNWDSTQLERWSPPTNFAKTFNAFFKTSEFVDVLLDFHLTKLKYDLVSERIICAQVSSLSKKNISVRADFYILAAGGLENARILLSNNERATKGLGNLYDMVGRFYQSHLVGVRGFVRLNSFKSFNYWFERDGPVYCRRRFRLSDCAQQKYKTGNIIGFFLRDLHGTGIHHDAISSAAYLAKLILGRGQDMHQRPWAVQRKWSSLLYHLGIIFKDGVQSGPFILKQVFSRAFSDRRLPYFLPSKRLNYFPLFYQAEQAPNFDSRVVLDYQNTDAFHIPRLKVRIKFSDVDFHTVDMFHALFEKRLTELGLGTFHQAKEKNFIFNSNAHHIGTTRMAATISSGVVDINSRVFGTHNCFMAGSSVFPTGGHANPTLLALSLSLRLASHIASL